MAAGRRKKGKRKTGGKSRAGQTKRRRKEGSSGEERDDSPIADILAGKWRYDLRAKLTEPSFSNQELIDSLVRKMKPEDLTPDYIATSGLRTPLLFQCPPYQLSMRMPNPKRFSVSDVRKLIGDQRRIEVIEVNTQRSRKMSLKDFVDYFKMRPNKRPELLNVLSLEFSLTDLANIVSAPQIIKRIDWFEQCWPPELRARQKSSTFEPASYPKVQKYCLMSVANCWTDFHIDFGGTSVWYHLLKGEKVFWMAPPTGTNLQLYEHWLMSGVEQDDVFLGDAMEQVIRLRLYSGDTFIIPSGWIHAVYTPRDSIVFGGNFLHSFAIDMQLRIYESETLTKVPRKFRYPYFLETLWYVVERVVRKATGRCYLDPISPEPEFDTALLTSVCDSVSQEPSRVPCSNVEQANITDGDTQPGDAAVASKSESKVEAESEDKSVKAEENAGGDSKVSLLRELDSVFRQPDPLADYEPPAPFDLEYLMALSTGERSGLRQLCDWLYERLTTKKGARDEVGEGIKSPEMILMDLALLKRHRGLSSDAVTEADKKNKVKSVGQVDEKKAKGHKHKHHDSTAWKEGSEAAVVASKEDAEMVKQEKKQKQLVDEFGEEEEVVGSKEPKFDPLASIIPLGHGSLPSALRKSHIRQKVDSTPHKTGESTTAQVRPAVPRPSKQQQHVAQPPPPPLSANEAKKRPSISSLAPPSILKSRDSRYAFAEGFRAAMATVSSSTSATAAPPAGWPPSPLTPSSEAKNTPALKPIPSVPSAVTRDLKAKPILATPADVDEKLQQQEAAQIVQRSGESVLPNEKSTNGGDVFDEIAQLTREMKETGGGGEASGAGQLGDMISLGDELDELTKLLQS